MKAATILRCSLRRAPKYLQLSLKEESTYSDIRAAIFACECVTRGYTAEQLLKQVQATPEPDTSAPLEVDRIYKGGGKENYKGKKGGKHKGKGKGYGFHAFLAKDVANLVAAEKANRKVRKGEKKTEESRKEKVNRTRATTMRHVGYVVILDIGRSIVPIVVALTKLPGEMNSGMEMISIIHQINHQGVKRHLRHNHRFPISLRNQMSSARVQGPSQPFSQGNRQMKNSQHPHPSQSSSTTIYPGSVGTSTFSGSVVRRIFDLDLPLSSSPSNSVRAIFRVKTLKNMY